MSKIAGITALLLMMAGMLLAEPIPESLLEEVRLLRRELAVQQKQIEELRLMVERQKLALASVVQSRPAVANQDGEIRQTAAGAQAPEPSAANLVKRVEELSQSLNGFRFSGDFRYRFDLQARSGNEGAPPLQNVRSRYRLRLNIDKDLDRRFGFHMQLSTGPYNNQITNDQDMAAMAVKHPFSLSEAYVDFHPSSRFSIRGGRMEEVFADNMRFLWDDDVRFNGFHQIVRLPLGDGGLGFQRLELRAGQYILSNPAVYVLPASSPFVAAGYRPGEKVRDANLFHPGFLLQGDFGTRWAHQLTGDASLYRNPNQIQLSSTAEGFPVVVSNGIGLQLSGPLGATGNATTTPGGAMYTARNFQIVRLAYRLEHKGLRLGDRAVPAWLDFQVSRNVGTGRLRDALMASANLGAVRRFGDVRFLYQFAIKDANALISQFTDDDLGTGSGVNIQVHALRFDLGLTRSLQWQNLLFIQNQRRASNPAEQFFVPLSRGANETFRFLGQLAFSF
jgi:Putative porin